jgi:hypothetical protein
MMLLRIDHRDRVAAIGDEWRRIARESGADHLLPGAEVGRPYRDYIRSNQVAEVYRMFLEDLRARRETVRFPVRADTAREKRRFLLEIESVGGGVVEFHLTPEGSEPRSPGDWGTPPEEDEMIRLCSSCKRAQLDLEWMELERAMEVGDLFGSFKHWQISHGWCPDCLKERMHELQRR